MLSLRRNKAKASQTNGRHLGTGALTSPQSPSKTSQTSWEPVPRPSDHMNISGGFGEDRGEAHLGVTLVSSIPSGRLGWMVGCPHCAPPRVQHPKGLLPCCLGNWTALSCWLSVYFLLQETRSKRLLPVSRGLVVGTGCGRPRCRICAGDRIFISAFSLLSCSWLTFCSQQHLTLV